MNLSDLLTVKRCSFASKAESKKQLFDEITALFSEDHSLLQQEIFEAFLSREKLGSTTLGHGVAIPHIRSTLVDQPLAVLVHIETPLDFNADDEQGVDLVFALIVPADEPNSHLELLAYLVSLLRHDSYRQALRSATSTEALFQLALHFEFENV